VAKREIPCVYIFIYKIIKERSNGRPFVSHDSVKQVFSRRWSFIPKQFVAKILKEMEKFQLVKRIGNTNNIHYELIGGDIDKVLNQYLSTI
jgi:hypothetical protein